MPSFSIDGLCATFLRIGFVRRFFGICKRCFAGWF